jgi:hypothetical protein
MSTSTLRALVTASLVLSPAGVSAQAAPAPPAAGAAPFDDPDAVVGAGTDDDPIDGLPAPGGIPAVLMSDAGAIVRIDGEARHVVLAKPQDGVNPAHAYQDLVVDEPSGRWAITRTPIPARGSVGRGRPWTVVFGDAHGVRSEVPGDPRCGRGDLTCLEEPVRFLADGGLLVHSMTRRGTTVARMGYGQVGRRELLGRAVGTTLTLGPDPTRAAYRSSGGVTLLDWDPSQGAARPRTRKVAVEAKAGPVELLALGADTIYLERTHTSGDGGRPRFTVEAVPVAGGRAVTVHRARGSVPGWRPLHTGPRGTVLLHDCVEGYADNRCDLIEVRANQPARVVARGISIAHDVSADGRFVLVVRAPASRAGRATAWPDLVIVDLASGADVRVLPEVMPDVARFIRA